MPLAFLRRFPSVFNDRQIISNNRETVVHELISRIERIRFLSASPCT